MTRSRTPQFETIILLLSPTCRQVPSAPAGCHSPGPAASGDSSQRPQSDPEMEMMVMHSGFACTKPPSRAVFMKNILQRGELFFGYSYCENKTCSESNFSRAFR